MPKPRPPKPLVTLNYDGGKPFVSGAQLISGTKYTITAQPNNITKSVVFKRDEVIRTDSGLPYEFIFTPTSLGAHIFSATPWSASGATGTSGPMVTVTFDVVDAVPPPEPVLKTAMVTWTQIANATGYKVFWGTHANDYSYNKDVGGNLSCQCPNLVPNTTYYFSAKSYNATQESVYGNEVAWGTDMIVDKLRSYDGWDSLAAGMDAGRRPSLIEQNQCAVARDVIFRGGVPETRPGYKLLSLDFEEEIFYNQEGDEMGPTTVGDGIITLLDPSILLSNTIKFTQNDVGSFLISDDIAPGTTIASVQSAGQATMDVAQAGGAPNVTFTIVKRTNPVEFIGDTSGDARGGYIHSIEANFIASDVGQTITGSLLPAGTFITQIAGHTVGNQYTIAYVNLSPLTVAGGLTFTIPARVPNLGSTDAFHDEPFQCASYYAPSNGNECIMATLGGRLFQITPKSGSARVREIQLSQYNPDPVTFTGNHIGPIITADNPVFTHEDIGYPISGGSLGADAAIAIVNSGTVAVMNASPSAEFSITFTLHRKHTTSRRNRRTIQENYMVQADRWHITQDGESKPIIFDGVVARRALDDEVIVGKIMAYGIGRLIVTRGRDIYFGDLFGSHEGDPSDSVLKFTETNFLSEGFPAEIPYTQGEITAAAFFPAQDTATGQGELVIFTERGAVSFDLHLPREEWKNSTFQQISLLNSSARGHRAVVMVNSDLWIRSDAGWRAYRQARAQATGWYQLPQSTEVTPWIRADTPALLRFGSAINFNNRLLVTSNPVPNSGRVYHHGLLSLDFSVLSSFGQSTRPAWDGHWGKLRILQLVSGTFKGQDRAFAFGLDDDDQTQLFEITTQDSQDFDGPVTSEIEFRSHNFNSPFNEKQLYGADIWVDKVSQPVNMELTFRSDSGNDYLPWKRFKQIRPAGGFCGEVNCGVCPTLVNGFAPRLKVGKPGDDCEEHTGRGIRRGFEFQPKLSWTGHAAIRRMRLHAMQEEEDPKGEC